MDFLTGHTGQEDAIAGLMEDSFGSAEGEDEGKLIASLARDLMSTTPSSDLFVYRAQDAETLVGCIIFSRLTFAEDERVVFLLSPVAVSTERQKQGIGQSLLTFGIAQMRDAGADVLMTYGSPEYYGKVGFQPISEDAIAAPLPLSFPHGWIGQSLNGQPDLSLKGTSHCVPALNKPEYW